MLESISQKLLEDIFSCYYKARKNNRNTVNQARFEIDLSSNLVSLYNDIINFRYIPDRCVTFMIFDPNPREIFASNFRDRIVHHLLYDYLRPIFEPTFIYDSYSCIKNRGTSFGINRLEHHIKSVSNNYTSECWVLKLDISGYFLSINRQILYDIIIKKLKNDNYHTMEEYDIYEFLLRKTIFNDPTYKCIRKGKLSDWEYLPKYKSLFYAKPGCGLPIGNLTSQLFSNIYMNELDQFCERVLKIKHYGRYVDDFYIVSSSKEECQRYIKPIKDFLENNLQLSINERKTFLNTQEIGVNFLGALLKNGERIVGKRTIKKMNTKLSDSLSSELNKYKINQTVESYKGHIKDFDDCKRKWYDKSMNLKIDFYKKKLSNKDKVKSKIKINNMLDNCYIFNE